MKSRQTVSAVWINTSWTYEPILDPLYFFFIYLYVRPLNYAVIIRQVSITLNVKFAWNNIQVMNVFSPIWIPFKIFILHYGLSFISSLINWFFLHYKLFLKPVKSSVSFNFIPLSYFHTFLKLLPSFLLE